MVVKIIVPETLILKNCELSIKRYDIAVVMQKQLRRLSTTKTRGSNEPERLVRHIYRLYIYLLRKRKSKENEHDMVICSGPLLETALITVQNVYGYVRIRNTRDALFTCSIARKNFRQELREC
jgi:hypothetical protein